MALLSGLVILAMILLVAFSFAVLRSIFSVALIIILGVFVLIPFLFLIHPWFELVIIVLLIVMIIQKQEQGY